MTQLKWTTSAGVYFDISPTLTRDIFSMRRFSTTILKTAKTSKNVYSRIRLRQPPKLTGVKTKPVRMADYAAVEDRVLDKSSRSSRGGRRGGGGQSREVQVSKALSKLLRHQAENAGIKLDGEGYAPLNRVLAWGPLKSLQVTLEDVKSVVESNEKQRFTLKPTGDESSTNAADYLIRANQGHSIKVDSAALLVPITLENVPEKVLHGTYFAFWPLIVESGGLKPMGRNHVHCSTGTPEEGVTSGMRKDAELIIEIDVRASLEAGDKWWLSDNAVVLSEGGQEGMVSSKYFKSVTGRKIDVGTLWLDGEKVGDLPPGIKARVPQGKGGRGRGGHRGR